MQQTLKAPTTLSGVGVHSGQMIELTLKPAPEGAGIIFVRTDQPEGKNNIPALWDKVVDTQLCSVIANDHGTSVGTIEHLMAALCALKIDNAYLEINGGEVPIMDGSAAPFMEAILEAGITQQNKPRQVIKILKAVSAEKDGKRTTLTPSDRASYSGEINFSHPMIGSQRYEFALTADRFMQDIARARTFGFLHEVEYLRSQGLAKGGSLDNAIVLDQETILNEGGLRFDNEFIRHKLLDAVGDLYLAGAHIQGAYEGYKPGHEMNNLILQALFSDDTAWEYVEDQ